MIVWLTGNSGAGKTTIAREFQRRHRHWIVLDGDEMRATISLGAGFDKDSRNAHNLRVARLANLLSQQGHDVIVSVIAPYIATRAAISRIAPCRWVHVHRIQAPDAERPYEVSPDMIKLPTDECSVKDCADLLDIYVYGKEL
jgi:adenylylsulfate kinase-like enzyme